MSDWTRVQGLAAESPTDKTITLSAAVTSGNVVTLGVLVDSGIIATKATDDKGNPYIVTAQGSDIGGGGQTLTTFVSKTLITNGPSTFTFTFNGTPASFIFKAAEEWQPPTGATDISLDGTTIFVGLNSTNPPQGLTDLQSSPFQTTQNDVLLWNYNVNQGTVTAGSGWTAGIADGANNTYTFSKIVAAASNANQVALGANPNTNWGAAFGIAPVKRKLWTPVQRVTFPLNAGPLTTMAMTLPNKVTAGNIVVSGFGAIAASLTSIVDDLGKHYEGNVLVNDASGSHALWWSGGQLNTTPQTFTITSSVGGAVAATLMEFAPPPGTSSVLVEGAVHGDKSGGGNVTTLSAPAITTTKPNDLVYSWISSEAVLGDNPLNGFNALNNWATKNSDAYFIQASPGSIAPAWNFFATNAALTMAVALSASGGGMPDKLNLGVGLF